jgi:toxin HigB-1
MSVSSHTVAEEPSAIPGFLPEAAARLDDLRVPPANRLEALAGKLRGLHSIRVNDQWHLVFRWQDDGPHEVAFRDYH